MGAERDVKIDALRGLAALGVLAFHAQNAWYLGSGSDIDPASRLRLMDHWLGIASIPVTFGWLGVNLFFVLSGLCIHYWHLNRAAQGRAFSYGAYLKRRFWRLYPAYLGAVVLSLALLALAEWLRQRMGAAEASGYARNALEQTLRYLTFTHTLSRDTLAGYNPPLYTLATEVHFYLLYPVVLWSFARWGARRTLLASVVLSGVLLALAYRTGNLDIIRPVEESALVRWPEWIAGCLVAEWWFGRRSGVSPSPRATLLLAGGALLGAGLYLLLALQFVLNAAWSFGLAALVVAYLDPRRAASSIERHLAAAGLFSYSLYLLHWPVLRVAALLLKPSRESLLPHLAIYALLSIAIVLLARAFFRWFERPFLAAPAR
jgi:peptidoglycan/LPS O-acetylase OafA/YrhL